MNTINEVRQQRVTKLKDFSSAVIEYKKAKETKVQYPQYKNKENIESNSEFETANCK